MRSPAKPLPDDVADYFYYDESSPSGIRWKIDRYVIHPNGSKGRLVAKQGDVAGYLRKDKYWTVKLFCRGIKVHRIVYFLHNPDADMPNLIIDHEDGDSSNNRINNLTESSDYKNGKNKSKYKNNSTGVSGIYLKAGNYAGSYVVTWRTVDKVPKRKLFSISKLGKDEAFRQACEYRERMIAELNAQGAGYSDRHGK